MTVRDVAAAIRKPEPTVRRAVRRGDLVAHESGERAYSIAPADFVDGRHQPVREYAIQCIDTRRGKVLTSGRIGRLFGRRLSDRKIWPARPSPAGKVGSPCLWPTTASHTRNDVG